jgi:hypothetical protein
MRSRIEWRRANLIDQVSNTNWRTAMKKNYSRPEVTVHGAVESMTQLKSYGNSHPIMWVD